MPTASSVVSSNCLTVNAPLFESFAESGEESALRAFAAETLPTLQAHYAQVHDLAGAEGRSAG